MPIPDYETIMLPLLKLIGDSKEYAFRDTVELLADELILNAERCYQAVSKHTSIIVLVGPEHI